MVRFAILPWLAFQLKFESHLYLLCMDIFGNATENDAHTSGKFWIVSDRTPPPPPRPSFSLCLSLSLRMTRLDKKWIISDQHDSQNIQEKVRSV